MKRLLALSIPFLLLPLGSGEVATEPNDPGPGDQGSGESAEPVAASIEVSAPATMSYGEVAQATAVVRDDRGEVMNDAQVSWTTSTGMLLNVSSDGSMSAVGTGTAVVAARSGETTGSAEIEVEPAQVPLMAPNVASEPYTAAVIGAPSGFTLPDAPSFEGSIAGAAVSLGAMGDTALALMVPAVAAGSYPLAVTLDENHVGRVLLEVAAPTTPPPADPGADVARILEQVDSLVAQVERALAESPDLDPAAGDLVSYFAQQLATWSDTASAESKTEFAAVLAANPHLVVADLETLGTSLAAAMDGHGTREAKMAADNSAAATSAMVTTGGILGMAGFCLTGALPACLVAVAATVGGVAGLVWSTDRLSRRAGVLYGNILAKFEVDLLDAANPRRVIAGSTEPLISGESYTLDVTADYRSVIAADAGLSSLLAGIVELLDEVDLRLAELGQLLDDMPSVFLWSPPEPPVGPGPAPAIPNSTAPSAAVAGEYLSIANVSSGVSVAFDPASRAIIVTADTAGETPFAFDLVYGSDITSRTTRVQGMVVASDPSCLADWVPGDWIMRAWYTDARVDPISDNYVSFDADGSGLVTEQYWYTDGSRTYPGYAATWSYSCSANQVVWTVDGSGTIYHFDADPTSRDYMLGYRGGDYPTGYRFALIRQ